MIVEAMQEVFLKVFKVCKVFMEAIKAIELSELHNNIILWKRLRWHA